LELSVDWERNGVPEHPRGLLVTVANRRMIDQIRSESARRDREERTLVGAPSGRASATARRGWWH
jgi:predicted RNA polymerase sigma factor